MESACVFEQTKVIHELNQGIKMAEQLRFNLNSPEAREFLIKNILSSYEKALFVLKSGGQLRPSTQPESSLPNSSTSTGSLQSKEFGFDENVFSKKRNASSPPHSPVFEITYKRIHTCNTVAQSPPPPPSPEKQETKPTNHHHHELLSANPGEILSNMRANLSVNTWGLDDILPSSFSSPSTPFGFTDDDFESLNYFPNYSDDELFQGYSPPFISPATSESNYLTDFWGNSSTMDFPTESAYLYPDFEYNSFL